MSIEELAEELESREINFGDSGDGLWVAKFEGIEQDPLFQGFQVQEDPDDERKVLVHSGPADQPSDQLYHPIMTNEDGSPSRSYNKRYWGWNFLPILSEVETALVKAGIQVKDKKVRTNDLPKVISVIMEEVRRKNGL